MREEFLEFEELETALARIFDLQPKMKSSSVAHALGTSSGIQIGSRPKDFQFDDEYILEATVKLRIESRRYYWTLQKWYSSNTQSMKEDTLFGFKAAEFHQFRLKALIRLSAIITSSEKLSFFQESEESNDDGPPKNLQPNDQVVIVEGELSGVIAYFDKYDGNYSDRIVISYFVKSKRFGGIVNIHQVRLL